jgi:arylsulfatase A-like enzyme
LLTNCGTSNSGVDGAHGGAASSGGAGAGMSSAAGMNSSGGSASGGSASSSGGREQGVGGQPSAGGASAAGAGTTTDGGEAGSAGASNAATPINVIFVLTDDLSWNLVKYMPHVQEMQRQGLTFSRYFVTDSLCCPSRSSIFTGKFPHNTGVFTNDAPNGGYDGFLKRKNQLSTFATALSAAGYRTGMMGKYLNLYKVSMAPDPGWSYWAVADNGYPEFDYYLRINATQKYYGKTAADYGVDVLSGLAQKFVASADAAPFALEVATFAPHGPYTPAPRYLDAFPELTPDEQHPGVPPAAFPRTPAWAARPEPDAPQWEQGLPALTDAEKLQEFTIFRKRAQAVQAVDDMIAALRSELEQKGLAQSTYVIFSSDNGFHLGEHSLFSGKQTAYDTDIRVPLVVVGPGVPAGVSVDAIAQNIDLCPTFLDVAGLPADATRDGRSLLPLFRGEKVTDWREFALVEHRNPGYDPSDPDSEPGAHSNPPSYEALATGDETYVEYSTDEREYFGHATDGNELHNGFPALAQAKRTQLHDALSAAKSCKGAEACWQAQHFGK